MPGEQSVSAYLVDPPLTTRERAVLAIADKALADTLLDGGEGDRIDWCRRADRRLQALNAIIKKLGGAAYAS